MTVVDYSPRCLIVGASGQVGAQICSILGPGRAVAASREAERPGWLQLDLAVLAAEPIRAANVIAALPLCAVYCVGGMTDVERCEREPDAAMSVNCHGPAALAAAAARDGVPFVYFSTEYVFDGKNGPYAEDAPPSPISVYGQSKWMGANKLFGRPIQPPDHQDHCGVRTRPKGAEFPVWIAACDSGAADYPRGQRPDLDSYLQ